MKKYDEVIERHYNSVAEEYGDSSTSTMLDDKIRSIETKSICSLIEKINNKHKSTINIADIGCGNGYTLSKLTSLFPKNNFFGVEYNQKLKDIASERFENQKNVKIAKGDIRLDNYFHDFLPDIVVCQRVLINLLDISDQESALKNLINIVNSGTVLIFIEAFSSGLNNLNMVRGEFGLDLIKPSHHNLYLSDSFFNDSNLKQVDDELNLIPYNFLSSHYFVSRAFYPGIIGNRKFKRNSEIAKYFSEALPPNIGDYSPLRFSCFEKK